MGIYDNYAVSDNLTYLRNVSFFIPTKWDSKYKYHFDPGVQKPDTSVCQVDNIYISTSDVHPNKYVPSHLKIHRPSLRLVKNFLPRVMK